MIKKFSAYCLLSLIIVSGIVLSNKSFSQDRVLAANSVSQTEVNLSIPNNYHTDICILGICVNTPSILDPLKKPIEDGANAFIKDQLRSFLSNEIPIKGTEHQLYPATSQLPGGQFTPQVLYLSALNASQVIPPGDYEIPVHFYCTKVYTLNGAGNRYRLARLNGRLSDALSALYQRASLNNAPIREVQVLSWSIQSGVSYNNLSSQSKQLVNQLIPEYRQDLEGSFIDKTIKYWDDISRLTSLPSLDSTLNSLGDTGTFARSLFRARDEIIRTNFNYRNLANAFVIPQDVNLPGGMETTPWSQINNQVYLRFMAPRGALNDGVVQVRVLGSGQANDFNQINLLQNNIDSNPSIASLPSNNNSGTSGVTAEALLNEISQSVGIPEQNGQALTATITPAPEGTVATIPSALPCNDPEIINKYDKNHVLYHYYRNDPLITICSKETNGCTKEQIFRIMLSEVRFVAPSQDILPRFLSKLPNDLKSIVSEISVLAPSEVKHPVVNCQETFLAPAPRIQYDGELPKVNEFQNGIKTVINPNNFSVTNYTLPGHIFYPGQIIRKVVDTGDSIKIETIGEGIGNNREINLLFGRYGLWDLIDLLLKEQVQDELLK